MANATHAGISDRGMRERSISHVRFSGRLYFVALLVAVLSGCGYNVDLLVDDDETPVGPDAVVTFVGITNPSSYRRAPYIFELRLPEGTLEKRGKVGPVYYGAHAAPRYIPSSVPLERLPSFTRRDSMFAQPSRAEGQLLVYGLWGGVSVSPDGEVAVTGRRNQDFYNDSTLVVLAASLQDTLRVEAFEGRVLEHNFSPGGSRLVVDWVQGHRMEKERRLSVFSLHPWQRIHDLSWPTYADRPLIFEPLVPWDSTGNALLGTYSTPWRGNKDPGRRGVARVRLRDGAVQSMFERDTDECPIRFARVVDQRYVLYRCRVKGSSGWFRYELYLRDRKRGTDVALVKRLSTGFDVFAVKDSMSSDASDDSQK